MGVVITPEDRDMFRFIHDHGGIVHKSLIKQHRYPNAVAAMDKRLPPLVTAGWLRRQEPVTDPVFNGLYWLGWLAIVQVAAERGVSVAEPAHLDGEPPSRSELRKLASNLHSKGVSWTDEPSARQVDHRQHVAAIQYAFERGCQHAPGLELAALERFDQSHPSPTPDLFFVIVDEIRQNRGIRISLEFDNSTHPIERLVTDKIVGGVEYLRTAVRHRDRANQASGRWLFVFRSKARMAEVQEQTQKAVGKNQQLFLFADYESLIAHNPISDPIWQVGNSKAELRLLDTA